MEEIAGLIPIIIIAVVSAISKSSNKKQQAQKHPYGSSAKPVSWPDASPAPSPRPASMASMLPPVEHSVAQPTVHTHFDPDCDTHDAPTSGSLGVRSSEGKDPCHDAQLPQSRVRLPEPAAEQPGLTLDWSGDAMVRAFVMQEVLTRPSDRRKH